MTEDEAKTKWCPFSRVGSGVSGLGAMNRDGHMPADDDGPVFPHTFCIGSACMAWRTNAADLSRLELEARVKNPEAVYPVQRAMMNNPRGGYCGLAGVSQ